MYLVAGTQAEVIGLGLAIAQIALMVLANMAAYTAARTGKRPSALVAVHDYIAAFVFFFAVCELLGLT